MMRPLAHSLLVAVIAIGVAHADEPLVWKWAEGDTARYQTRQTTQTTVDAGPAGRVESESRLDTVMRWTVDGVEDDGAARLRQRVERVVMSNRGPFGQDTEYDSDDPEPPIGIAALVAPMFEALLAHDIEVRMLPTGEIADVTLSDELADAVDRLPGGAMSAEMITQMVKQGAFQLPQEPLVAGRSWTTEYDIDTPQIGALRVRTTYTYDGLKTIDGAEYESFTPVMELESDNGGQQGLVPQMETTGSSGEILFDRDAGRVHRSRLELAMTIRVPIGEREAVSQMNQVTEMFALDEGEPMRLDEAAEPAASMAE